jgi:hypothetical protein
LVSQQPKLLFRLAQQHSVTVLYTISSNPPAKLAESGIRPVVAPLPHMDEDGRVIAPFIWNLTVNSQILLAVFGEGDHQMGQLDELHSEKAWAFKEGCGTLARICFGIFPIIKIGIWHPLIFSHICHFSYVLI